MGVGGQLTWLQQIPGEGHVLIGIDGGGTKTECCALSLRSGTHCRLVGGGSNYQGTGIARARAVWKDLVERSLAHLDAGPEHLAAAGLGIAGLDRPKDDAVIRTAFSEILGEVPFELVNDAYLALRAGTVDGVGVAVVSGTGCNAMGTARDGRRFRVGGIGPEFGDLGSASDIGVEALRAAFRAQDDRGPPTVLATRLESRLGLERLDDLVDFFLADNETSGEFTMGMVAPLVFQAAAEGDGEAVRILRWAGRELGLSARAVARNLFSPDVEFFLVLGGSVLQKGLTSHVVDALVGDVRVEFPKVMPVVLESPPVAGAVRYALDLLTSAAGDQARTTVGDWYHTIDRLLRS